MTAPRTCESCGAALDAGEVCDCRKDEAGALIRVTQLPVIEEQLRTVKDRVDASVKQALALVCNEETLAAVKNTRADIGKQFKELEDMRKAVKKAVMGPYERFEAVYWECVSDAFRRADADLKGKIDATEQEIKGRCEKQLEAYFQELCAVNHVDFLTFAQTGVKVDMASARAKAPKKLMDRLRVIVEGCAQAMATIDGMEHGDEIAVEYKKCLDLTFAIRLVTERHQKLEAERQLKAEAEAACIRFGPGPEPAEVTPVPKRVQKAAVERLTCTFTVTDTRERLKLLKNFLDSNGYQYK